MKGAAHTRVILLISLFAILLMASGCGVTRQYTIPKDQEGKLHYDSRAKLRMAACVNCDFWNDEERPASGYLPAYSKDELTIGLSTSYRCFGWFLVIPFPFWGSCSSAVNVPRRQLVHVRIENKGKTPWTSGTGGIRAFKGNRELEVRQSQPFPIEIHPGESIIRAFDVGGWDDIGWGYELDLSGLVGDTSERIPFERFTSTTFGVYFTR